MRNAPWLITVLVLAFVTAAKSSAQNPLTDYGELNAIRRELQRKTAEGAIPSVSIGVLRKDEEIWKESFGFANLERKLPASSDTIYALGSLSKSITATAVFKLTELGKIDLEKPIDRYLKSQKIERHGRAPSSYRVYHYLNMAAGIPHYWRYCYEGPIDLQTCAGELSGDASFSAFASGSLHLYSNFSFGIAANLVSDVSGGTFSDFARTHILIPAGMKRTYFHLNDISKTEPNFAVSYKANGENAGRFQFEPAGGGGYYSTVNDLLKYARIHLGDSGMRKPVLRISTLSKIHRVRPGLPSEYYANGWGVLTLPEKRSTLISNGAIEGAASTLLIMPDAGIAVVVLINKTVGNDVTDDIAFRIIDALEPGYKKEIDALFEKLGPQFSPTDFKGDKELDGEWKGLVSVRGKKVPVKMIFEGTAVSIQLGKTSAVRVERLTTGQGLSSGIFTATGAGEMLGLKSDRLELKFRRAGRRIEGIIQAEILEPRPEFMLARYLSAER